MVVLSQLWLAHELINCFRTFMVKIQLNIYFSGEAAALRHSCRKCTIG